MNMEVNSLTSCSDLYSVSLARVSLLECTERVVYVSYTDKLEMAEGERPVFGIDAYQDVHGLSEPTQRRAQSRRGNTDKHPLVRSFVVR